MVWAGFSAKAQEGNVAGGNGRTTVVAILATAAPIKQAIVYFEQAETKLHICFQCDVYQCTVLANHALSMPVHIQSVSAVSVENHAPYYNQQSFRVEMEVVTRNVWHRAHSK